MYNKQLAEKIEKHLDMYGKRWMFLKIFFPTLISRLSMEATGQNFGFDLANVAKNHGIEQELEKRMEEVFGEI